MARQSRASFPYRLDKKAPASCCLARGGGTTGRTSGREPAKTGVFMTVQDAGVSSSGSTIRRRLTLQTKAFCGSGSLANGIYGSLGGLALFFYS